MKSFSPVDNFGRGTAPAPAPAPAKITLGEWAGLLWLSLAVVFVGYWALAYLWSVACWCWAVVSGFTLEGFLLSLGALVALWVAFIVLRCTESILDGVVKSATRDVVRFAKLYTEE